MNKKGHWVFGLIVSFIFILFTGYLELDWFRFSLSSILILIGIVLFYSILPDIDHKSGTMTWFFIGISSVGVVFGIFQFITGFGNAVITLIISGLLLVFTFISANFMKHRGFIHTVQLGIVSVIPLWYLFGNIGYCILGYVAWHSHLLGDGYLFKIR